MRNRSRATAVGATAFLGVGDQVTGNTGVLLGIKPRVRRWTGQTISLDFSPGLFYVLSGDANVRTVGLTAHTAVNVGDWVALTGQIVVAKSPSFGTTRAPTNAGLYLGGKLGSYPGGISAVAAPVAVLVFALLGGFRDD